MKANLLAFLAVTTLSACSATGDDYIRGQAPAIFNHPLMGNLTLAERELLGPDANQNGVRDDIDLAISKLSDEKRPDMTRYIQGLTRGMISGSRAIASTATEKSSATLASPLISETEKKICADLLANTAARKTALTAWQNIQE